MKNTFTFPHDFGARNDPALQDIIFEYGPAAGFAYWVLIEMLYEQGGKLPRSSYAQVAYQAHVDTEMIKGIIERGTLFKTDKNFFWSDRVVFTLETKEDKASKSRTAAQVKWANWKKKKELEESADASAMHPQSESKADAMPNNNNSNNNSNSNNIESKDSCPQDEKLFGEGEVEVVPKDMTPEEMVEIWNQNRGGLSKTKLPLIEERKKKARLRIKEFGKTREEQMAVMEEVVKRLAASPFANGENDRGWRATFGFLLEKEKWANVLDGMYDRKPNAGVKDIRDIKDVNALWRD